MLHFWFIPVVPLFYSADWSCEECGDSGKSTSSWFVWALSALAAANGVLFFLAARYLEADGLESGDLQTRFQLVSLSSFVLAVLLFVLGRFMRNRSQELSAEVKNAFHE